MLFFNEHVHGHVRDLVKKSPLTGIPTSGVFILKSTTRSMNETHELSKVMFTTSTLHKQKFTGVQDLTACNKWFTNPNSLRILQGTLKISTKDRCVQISQ
jgi:hypothetical protein